MTHVLLPEDVLDTAQPETEATRLSRYTRTLVAIEKLRPAIVTVPKAQGSSRAEKRRLKRERRAAERDALRAQLVQKGVITAPTNSDEQKRWLANAARVMAKPVVKVRARRK